MYLSLGLHLLGDKGSFFPEAPGRKLKFRNCHPMDSKTSILHTNDDNELRKSENQPRSKIFRLPRGFDRPQYFPHRTNVTIIVTNPQELGSSPPNELLQVRRVLALLEFARKMMETFSLCLDVTEQLAFPLGGGYCVHLSDSPRCGAGSPSNGKV